jgi:hypothetical protein
MAIDNAEIRAEATAYIIRATYGFRVVEHRNAHAQNGHSIFDRMANARRRRRKPQLRTPQLRSGGDCRMMQKYAMLRVLAGPGVGRK